MAPDWTLSELESMSPRHLDSVYERPTELPPPRGVWRGHVLARIEHETSEHPFWRWSERLGFEWNRFGIDFDRRLWFFWTRRLAMGRFEPRVHRSRWRDTDAIGLHYEVSRLPAFVRGVLYDEVKPLSERWMLGIGGMNGERGVGDHFWFALERRPGDLR
ncbi:MAG TPA: hypothetical protein RMH99_21300 [Sandaracinaceae bacterium LLY-WYZ-13_1]|nr:hypothetical protein [Sandaracinaceae bacterium LLY-WYZ-13_1]